jgi:hypothetical protein
MRFGRLLVLGLVTLMWGVGCATAPDVAFDFRPGTDFAQLVHWSWQRDAGPRVYAPHADARGLQARVAQLIEARMREAGFEKGGRTGPSDFAVHYQLTLQRKAENVEVPLAPQLVSSYSSSASYWVEGTKSERREFDDLTLTIDVSVGAGQVIWHATYDRRLQSAEQVPLEEAVVTLLEQFPPEAR